MTSHSPPTSDRAGTMAHAVVQILAAQGARAVTHRAVDRHLGFPEGSTSSYLRTRDALLLAAADVLETHDRDLLASARAELQGQKLTTKQAAALLARTVERWTSGIHAAYQLARVELLLEARRSPQVAARMNRARAGFLELARVLLEQTGRRPTSRQVTALVDVHDGLTFDLVFHPDTAIGHDDLEPTFLALLHRF